ncbi:MAG: hypothetical protein ABL880_07975 [Methylotenera sp.]
MLKVFASLIVCVILASGQTALANDVYRCGTTYQDTPCKNAASKPINEKLERKNVTPGVSKTTQKVQIPASANTDCKLRGESAKSIANMRDTGLSEETLKANAADSYTAALVTDVYKRTGSAFQIQNTIERECVQQQQKQSLTSKWMAQAKRLLGVGAAPANANVKNKTSPQSTATSIATNKTAPAKPAQPQVRSTADPKPVLEPTQPVPAPPVQPEPSPQPEQPAPIQVEPPAPEPPPPAPVAKPSTPPVEPAPQKPAEPKEVAQEDSQGMCSALKAGLANIASQKRKGGDATFMKDLKEQQTELENVMKSAGC